MKNIKRLLALLLAFVLCLSLCACDDYSDCFDDDDYHDRDDRDDKDDDDDDDFGDFFGPGQATQPNSPIFPGFGHKYDEDIVISQIHTGTEGPLFSEPTKINVYTGVNETYDIEGNYIDQLLEQENIDLNHVEMEDGVFLQMIVDHDLPDITYLNANMYGNDYGPEGAFINVLEYLDQMPNLKAYLKANPEYVEQFLAENGALYHIPVGNDGENKNLDTAAYAFIYREDIFEKHGLTFPTTRDEFYNTLKKLKELYPNSYPFVLRQMEDNMQGMMYLCMSFGTQLALPGATQTIMDYDHETESWYYGPTSDGMKDMVSFLAQLYREGLLHKSTITLTSAQWTEAFAKGDDRQGVSFIGWDKMDRIPAQLQPAGQALNPDFKLVAGAPIQFNGMGVAATYNSTYNSFLVSANCKNLVDTLAYIDWLYSEEGMITTNWGKEGETFEYDENGKPRWLPALLEERDPQYTRGLAVPSIYGIKDVDAYLQLQSPEHIENIKLASAYQTLPGRPTLIYTKEEQTIYNTYWQAVFTYSRGELQKFICGERDLSTWDNYVKTVESDTYMFDQLMKIHEVAYNRKLAANFDINELLG